MEHFEYLIPAVGVFALIYTLYRANWVAKQEEGTDRMKTIAGYIADGAMAFLKAEYKVLGIYVVIASLCLGYLSTTSERSSYYSSSLYYRCYFFLPCRFYRDEDCYQS